ncbi:6-carboxytetrahydropterin synthase [Staphylococcus sp. 17KM0847]|uniref:6-pyruvoyl trahydropterin synthase family protein n=1 Tax=Staphylococcus sp. 17KM0847 TaxID=2583989 RepID=UPI0015DCEA2D|nr:6-carboxytetrahydropterin synthase [Staphylococcus sp. 17KM0847]QLK86779.1 6-pyruvoyl tetrahydrobiopterin synthase [Staphylococcus sp. 17KM0847]
MSRFSHLHPPTTYACHHKTLIVLKHFTFVCDNRIYFSDDHYIDLEDHPYTLDIELYATTDTQGIAVDFHQIDQIYHQYLEPLLEGQLLNDTLPVMNTTAENIAYWAWLRFEKYLPQVVQLNTLTLYEIPEQGIKLTRSIMAQ